VHRTFSTASPTRTIRVVRDIFNEDFTKLVIASNSEWDLVDEYVRYVAPNLAERLERWADDKDLFTAYRIDEQLTKALDRKVWLPSGGSLVIDTTEAMTVIDVNTGKFTGQGGNLEQTVTRNNLEAAEEIVRQLRLRDIGGIIVIDFIDMVLESNRDLVLRRLIECLARDRTKHQVAEVTSLGLVQMTRKQVGSGLLAAFSVRASTAMAGILVSTELTELPPSHGRNGSQGGTPKPGTCGAGRQGARRSHRSPPRRSTRRRPRSALTTKRQQGRRAPERPEGARRPGRAQPNRLRRGPGKAVRLRTRRSRAELTSPVRLSRRTAQPSRTQSSRTQPRRTQPCRTRLRPRRPPRTRQTARQPPALPSLRLAAVRGGPLIVKPARLTRCARRRAPLLQRTVRALSPTQLQTPTLRQTPPLAQLLPLARQRWTHPQARDR
jgi:ribonuclease E